MMETEQKKQRREIEQESLPKRILFFILALIPALMLGVLLIYLADQITREYKMQYNPQDYGYYPGTQSSKPSYWHYLQRMEQIRKEEKALHEESRSAFEQIGESWQDYKEQIRLDELAKQREEKQRLESLQQNF